MDYLQNSGVTKEQVALAIKAAHGSKSLQSKLAQVHSESSKVQIPQRSKGGDLNAQGFITGVMALSREDPKAAALIKGLAEQMGTRGAANYTPVGDSDDDESDDGEGGLSDVHLLALGILPASQTSPSTQRQFLTEFLPHNLQNKTDQEVLALATRHSTTRNTDLIARRAVAIEEKGGVSRAVILDALREHEDALKMEVEELSRAARRVVDVAGTAVESGDMTNSSRSDMSACLVPLKTMLENLENRNPQKMSTGMKAGAALALGTGTVAAGALAYRARDRKNVKQNITPKE